MTTVTGAVAADLVCDDVFVSVFIGGFSLTGQDVGAARAACAWGHDHGGVSVTWYVDATEPRATYWYACGQRA